MTEPLIIGIAVLGSLFVVGWLLLVIHEVLTWSHDDDRWDLVVEEVNEFRRER